MRNLYICGLIVAWLAGSAHAQPAAGQPAREILDHAMKHAAELRSAEVDIRLSSKITVGEQVQDAAMDATLQMRGNSDLRIHVTSQQSEGILITNSEKKYVHLVSDRKYIEEKAHEPRAELIGMMSGGILRMGSIWLGKFITNDPSALQELQSVEVVDEEGEAAHKHTHLLLKYAKYDLDLWLFPSLLPEKLHMNLEKSYSTKIQTTVKRSAIVDFVFSNWRENAPLADALFTFTPPEGVTLQKAYADTSGNGESPLVGKPAPPIQLDMIDGAKMDLAAHKGKDVVLIDFWATWCGPCRMSLPIIVGIANDFKGKGVAFYTVDLQETREKVAAFQEKNKLAFPVAIDKSGQVAIAYQASSIPTTVLVDRKGNVRQIYKGFSPNEREEIAHLIDTMLAEK